MPVNRNALIRFRTIDNCLRNRYRKWTLEDLIDACSEALYEYEGISKGVSRRTVQMDLQLMRSDKLGYNAPIVVIDKRYYAYEDPDFSITNIPLTDKDLEKLTEVVDILRQFKGFTHFQDLNGMVHRLEDRIHTVKANRAPIIDLEKNEHLKGLEHIDCLYKTIHNKRPIEITYQSFKAREANTFIFHPYFLKEYRNRWFLMGVKGKGEPVMNLALDRIKAIGDCSDTYLENTDLRLPDYFENVIGVSVSSTLKPEVVELFVSNDNAPYVLTKPLHHTQELLEQNRSGIIIRLRVQHNFELEREIMGFGDSIKVLQPAVLKRRIHEKMRNAFEQYNNELQLKELDASLTKLKWRGYAVLDNMYTDREVRRILSYIHRMIAANVKRFPKTDQLFAIRCLLKELPGLKPLLFNFNLCKLLQSFGEGYFLTKAIYFDKLPQSNWFVPWHQDVPINVKEKAEVEGFYNWTHKNGLSSVCPPLDYLHSSFTVRIHLDDADEENGALKVIPKSHLELLSTDQIAELRDSSESKTCRIKAGGVQLLKPLTLHASSRSESERHRRVIHLEFNNRELPRGLEWLEREEV